MAIKQNDYIKLKKCYGIYGSWAIWEEPEEGKPASNTSKIELFNDDFKFLKDLNNNYVFVGLNWSKGSRPDVWSNFHSNHRGQNDYKLRYALQIANGEYRGSYITDIIKDFVDPISTNVLSAYKKVKKDRNNEMIVKNREWFLEEWDLLGKNKNGEKPIVVAMGNATKDILIDMFRNAKTELGKGVDYPKIIIEIPHYAKRVNKETYAYQVADKIEKKENLLSNNID